MPSLLKPEMSVGVGLATAVTVFTVYNHAMPAIADERVADADDDDLAAAERSAAWISAGIVAGISLIAKDPTIFVIGGAMTVALSWWHRHGNAVNPTTGKASYTTDDSAQYDTEMEAA